MNFLQNLSILLDDHGMTKAELARQIKIAPSTINAWYTKSADGVSLKTLLKISKLFDVTIEDLVNGDVPSLHFSMDEYSQQELNAIKDFSNYIKNKRQE